MALISSYTYAGDVVELNDISVSGQRLLSAGSHRSDAETERDLTPGAVTIVDTDKVSEGQVSGLADMLRYVPGVWSNSSDGGAGLFFSSRGSNLDGIDYDKNGIKLLQDGLPISSADGSSHNHAIDPLTAKYAVFAHGANAMKYGASTLGGAMDFATPMAEDLPRFSWYSNYGSHGTVANRLSASGANEVLDGTVTVEKRKYDGYRDQSSQDRLGIYANAGITLSDKIATRFYLTHLEDNLELPGGLTRQEVRQNRDQAARLAKLGDYSRDVKIFRLANKTTIDIDENSKLEFGLAFEEQELNHPIVFNDYAPDAYTLYLNNRQQNISTMARYHYKTGNHQWLFGINYADMNVRGGQYNNDYGHRGDKRLKESTDANTLELYAMDRWQFADRWTLVAGAQFTKAKREVQQTKLNGEVSNHPDKTYNSINPTVGLIYDLTPNSTLYGNISRVYEPPTTYQLTDKTGETPIALNAMDGVSLEIGSRGEVMQNDWLSWNWDVSLYHAEIDNEILAANIDDPRLSDTDKAVNIDKTTRTGVEALVAADIKLDNAGTHHLTPVVSLSINDFQFDDDDSWGNNDLPAAPKYALRGEVLYRHANGFYAGPTFDLIGKRYADFANTYTIDNYALMGLKTGWGNERFRVFAEVRNLFDRDYIATHGVITTPGEDNQDILYPGEPRSAYVGFELNYD